MRTSTISSLILLLAISCTDKGSIIESDTADSGNSDTGVNSTEDADDDGWSIVDGDCDDENDEVFPGAIEECDGVDNNCNSVVDEGFSNQDGDDLADCVDIEECDGVDNDGDGDIDEGFEDVDGDGEADCVDVEECDGIDNNGNGEIDEGFDGDGDGFGTCQTGDSPGMVDCNDSEASVYPGATENVSNSMDDDCDGLIDEDDSVYIEGSLIISEVMNNPSNVADIRGEWFEVYNPSEVDVALNGLTITDVEGLESHRISTSVPVLVPAGGYAVLGNNLNQSSNGGVAVDYQYDGLVLSNESDSLRLEFEGVLLDQVMWDNGATMPDVSGRSMQLDILYYDSSSNDISDYWCAPDDATPGMENGICEDFDHDGDGLSMLDGDCDDYSAQTFPGAAELESSTLCMADADEDGYGDGAPVNNTIVPGVDCNDADGLVFPGSVMESSSLCLLDADGDGYGDANAPSPYDNGTDCDDSSADISPMDVDGDGTSACAGDCDDTTAALSISDSDGDGTSSCAGDCDDTLYARNLLDSDGDGVTTCDGDCNDSDPSTGAIDIDGDGAVSCWGDCNDFDAALNLQDLDGDGYTTCDNDCNDYVGTLTPADDDGDGYSTCDSDCDDANALQTPADNDGDGLTTCGDPLTFTYDCNDFDATIGSTDVDGDGFLECIDDCDDSDALLNPNDNDGDGNSTCDGDCDDTDATLNSEDADADGSSTCDGDCDDTDSSQNLLDLDGDGSSTCDGDCNDLNSNANLMDLDGDGITTCDSDCNDYDASIGQTDVDGDGSYPLSCFGNDCDDNDATVTGLDADGDGETSCAGDCDDSDATLTTADADGDGYSSCDGDCDDADTSMTPVDLDGDGYSVCTGDCDDTNSTIYTGNTEIVGDGFDNDCDGTVD